MPPTPPLSLRHRALAAAFRIRRIAANARVDLRYGSLLALDRQSTNGFVNVRSSDYAALDQIFGDLIRPDDVLVDIGSATGRVINFWLDRGYRNRMIGLEMNPVSAERAAKRLEPYGNVEIVAGDATELLPPDGTVFYVYNPFGPEVMAAFRDRVATLPAQTDRPVILYYNPKYLEVFEADERFRVEMVELEAPEYAPLSSLAKITFS